MTDNDNFSWLYFKEFKMAKYRFRLLHGTHKTEPVFKLQQNGEMAKVGDGMTYVGKHPNIPYTMEAGYKGDIIETDLNLSAMFDQKGAIPKFQDITRGDVGDVDTEESLLREIEERKAKLATMKGGKPAFGTDTLDGMTVDELKKMAAEEEIDLGKAKTQPEILAIVKKAMAVTV